MNILLFLHPLVGLGDSFLISPIFDSLRKKYKEDKLTLYCSKVQSDFFYGKDWFDEILIDIETKFPRHEYDRVINLDAQKCGVTLFHRPDKHLFKILEESFDVEFDYSKFDEIFKVNCTEDEMGEIDSLISKQNTKYNIVVHTTNKFKFPYCKTPSEVWWTELVKKLKRKYEDDLTIYQIGTKVKYEERIVADYDLPHVVDLRDTINLRQISYMLTQLNTYVSCDTVTPHLSLNGRKKGIVIWGSSNPITHAHDHNINLLANRPCGKPCVDLTGFVVPDFSNSHCCLIEHDDFFPEIEKVINAVEENI